MGGSFYYAVNQGHEPGVYRTWSECEKNVKGFKGARFKKFSSFEEAEAFKNMPIAPLPSKKHETSNKEKEGMSTHSTTKIQRRNYSEKKTKMTDTASTPITREPLKDNENFIPLTQCSDKCNETEDEFLKKFGNQLLSHENTNIERTYSDIIINADGEEINEEPTVIKDLSDVLHNLSNQFEQYERLKQRNKWVFIDTMTWLKDCANNNWKTTAGKQITSDEIQSIMDKLMELKQCM